MSKALNSLLNNPRYDSRIYGDGVSYINDTRITNTNNNTCIIGASGSGKTSWLYTQLKALQNESVIVSDSKGLLSKMFKKELIDKGYTVKVLSLINWKSSDHYNPLMHIRRNKDGSVRYQDVISLSKTLCPDNMDDEPIWALSAQNVIQLLIGYTLEYLPSSDWNMDTVVKLFHKLTEKNGLDIFMRNANDNPSSFVSRKIKDLQSCVIADKMISSIYAFVSVALNVFELPEAKNLFNPKNAINLRDIGRKKTALFIECSDTDHSFDNIQSILFSQAFQVLLDEADNSPDGKLPVPVNLFCDDFAANINIPDVDRLISVIRSRDLFMTYILQSLSQLTSLYGEHRSKTILNNSDTICYLGANDIDTATYIATRMHTSVEKILDMPRDSQVLIRAGEKAKMIKKFKPYQYGKEADTDKNISTGK